MPDRASARRQSRAYTVAAALLVIGISAVTSFTARQDLTALRERSRENLERLSEAKLNAGSQVLERMLDHVRALQLLGKFSWLLETEGDDARAETLRDHLRHIVAYSPNDILQFAVIDRHGRLAWSTVPGFTPVDLSDREHFAVHAQGRTKVFFSKPVIGRASGRWSIQITAGILAADGTFNGVVVASVDPSGISRDLAAISASTSNHFTLLRDDGMILARSDQPDNFTQGKASPQLLSHLQGAHLRAGNFVRSEGGQQVFTRWTTVGDWPIFLVHEHDGALLEQEVAKRRRQLAVMLALTNGLSLGLIALLTLALAHRRSLREAEHEAAQRRSLTEVINALPAAVYRITLGADGQPRCVRTGARFALITGKAPADGDGDAPSEDRSRDWAMHLAEEDQRAREAMLIEVAAGSDRMIEYELVQPSGRRLWIRDRAALLRTAPDGAAEVVGTIADITEEREAAARARHADRLASLGGMATGMAHEMSQPAAAIALAADLALLDLRPGSPADAARLEARLEQICEHAMRMRDVVDLFRVFGRSEGQDHPGEFLDLAALVDGACRLVQGSMNTAGVALDVALPSPCPRVFGQRVALEQVLVNLFLNARDALVERGGAARGITLAAAPLEDARGRWVRISVRDNGPGFSEEALQRWGEPFFTTKAPGKGTGLGLPIAHGIVKRFGGTMTLGNRQGAEIELLLAAEPAREAEPPQELAGLERQDG